jgi:hypothetical protein
MHTNILIYCQIKLDGKSDNYMPIGGCARLMTNNEGNKTEEPRIGKTRKSM